MEFSVSDPQGRYQAAGLRWLCVFELPDFTGRLSGDEFKRFGKKQLRLSLRTINAWIRGFLFSSGRGVYARHFFFCA